MEGLPWSIWVPHHLNVWVDSLPNRQGQWTAGSLEASVLVRSLHRNKTNRREG